jgi:predicted nucleic acid-binding protein
LSEQQSAPPRALVLDTSVAVKWYLPEDLHEQALGLARRVQTGEVELLAPGTLQPEFFNALWQQHKRNNLPVDEVRSAWEQFALDPVTLYLAEDLMPRAAEITFETGVIVYDALFLALAEEVGTVVVTADSRLLKSLEETAHARLARHLADVGKTFPYMR